VRLEQQFVGSLSEVGLHELPVGIRKEINGTEYLIVIDSLVLYPHGAFCNAFMSVDFPGSSSVLAFAARGLVLTPSGIKGGALSRLYLVHAPEIQLGPNTSLLLSANGNTFVDWDCNGFTGIGLGGQLRFRSDLIYPASQPDEDLKTEFSIYASDLQNLIFSVSLPPFRIKGLQDFSFEVQQATLDLSSMQNASSMQFPATYAGTGTEWTGVYCGLFSVEFPPEFNRGSLPMVLQGARLIIDDSGITGALSMERPLPQGSGDMMGWRFGLSHISLEFVQNQLVAGGLSGELNVPLLEEQQALKFTGIIHQHPEQEQCDFLLSLQSTDTIGMSVWNAQMQIHPGSALRVERRNGKFHPQLILQGGIAFGSSSFESGFFAFQDLRISTNAPFIEGGYFSLTPSGEARCGGFPLYVESIGLLIQNQKPELHLSGGINFMEQNDMGFSAATHIRVLSKIEDGKLQYDQTKVDAISIALQTMAFRLSGQIAFFENDPLYGKGFSGELNLCIPEVLDPGFSARAIFGRQSFRYFSVDAFVPVTIPLGPTPMSITRLKGGLSYRMRPQNTSPNQYISTLFQDPPPGNVFTQPYVPDAQYGLNFRAGVSAKFSPSERAFNADGMLALGFTPAGGLQEIFIGGRAFMLCTVAERLQKPASVQGQLTLHYLAGPRIFDADFQASVNVTNVISGQGNAHFHHDPQYWYFCAGRPSAPVSVNLINFISGQAYLMTGNQLEPMAAPPAQVAGLFSGNRNSSALQNGTGVVAGIRVGGGLYGEVGGENLRVYGSFAYGAGTDLMLVNFGPNAHCEENGSPAGLNGWVLEGRLYAYLQGNIGVAGKFLGEDFDIVILSGSVAALLEGQLPNPSYLRGAMQCSYSLFGAIEGSVQLEFETGQTCSVVNG
jgi:hypothetical protein